MTINQAKAFAEQIEDADKLRGLWVNARNAEHCLATVVTLATEIGRDDIAEGAESVRGMFVAAMECCQQQAEVAGL